MRSEKEINSDLKEAITTYNKTRSLEDGEKVKALRQELIDILIEGAEPCSDCGNMPIGVKQSASVGSMVFSYYEIGCVVCRDHKAKSQIREEAVDNWNNRIFVTK